MILSEFCAAYCGHGTITHRGISPRSTEGNKSRIIPRKFKSSTLVCCSPAETKGKYRTLIPNQSTEHHSGIETSIQTHSNQSDMVLQRVRDSNLVKACVRLHGQYTVSAESLAVAHKHYIHIRQTRQHIVGPYGVECRHAVEYGDGNLQNPRLPRFLHLRNSKRRCC